MPAAARPAAPPAAPSPSRRRGAAAGLRRARTPRSATAGPSWGAAKVSPKGAMGGQGVRLDVAARPAGGDHGRQEFTECCGLTCIALAEIESQRTYLLNRIDVPRRTRGASPARTDPTTLSSTSATRSNVDKSAGGPKSDTSSRSVPGGGSGLLAADPARARNAVS